MANKTVVLKDQAGNSIYPNVVKENLPASSIFYDDEAAGPDGVVETPSSGSWNIAPTLNLIDLDSGEIRTSITEEEYNNLKNGLYNSVIYFTEIPYDMYLQSKLFSTYDDSDKSLYCTFSSIKVTATSVSDISSTNIIYQLNIGQKDTSGNYPITIEKVMEIPFGSGSSGASGGGVNFLQATIERADEYGNPEGTYTGTVDPNKVNIVILNNVLDAKYTLLTNITDEGVGSATIIVHDQPMKLSLANNEIHMSPAGIYFHSIHITGKNVGTIYCNYYSNYPYRYGLRTFKDGIQTDIVCSGFVKVDGKQYAAVVIKPANDGFYIGYFDGTKLNSKLIDKTTDVDLWDQVFDVATGEEKDVVLPL